MKKTYILWAAAAVIAAVVLLALTLPAASVNENIDGARLTQLQSGGARVVDVRTPSEYTSGHIPNALNVPVDQLQSNVTTWDKDQAVVVYCATGARSADAAAYLVGQGFRKVYDLAGGLASRTGELSGGQATASVPTGPGAVKTAGKPVFVYFSSST